MQTTTDHAKIKQWAETQQAKPAVDVDPDDEMITGELRFNFPSNDDERDVIGVKDISWDDFFQQFEDRKYALSYDGQKYEFVDRSLINPDINEDASSEDVSYNTKV